MSLMLHHVAIPDVFLLNRSDYMSYEKNLPHLLLDEG